MLLFFDYVYYKSCQFYYKHGEGNGSGISGLAFLSLIQFLNLISIITIFWLIFPNKFSFTKGDKIIGGLIYIIIVIINAFRYNRLNFDSLKERWDDEENEIKRKKKIGVISYMVISIIVVGGLIFRKLIFSGSV